jgi:hypothetical protein
MVVAQMVPASPLLRVIVAVGFLVVVLFFTMISIFLNYHWHTYEVDPARTRIQRWIYFSVSSVLVLAMIIFGLLSIL